MGSVHGRSLSVPHAISGSSPGAPGGDAALIVLTDDAAACEDVTANRQPKNAQFLVLALADVNPSTGAFTAPVAAGDYQVVVGTGAPPAKVAGLHYSPTDTACKAQLAMSAEGKSGVVHLTSVSNGIFSGTFDLMVAETDMNGAATSTTDHLTGSFHPSACAGIGAAFSSNSGTVTCY